MKWSVPVLCALGSHAAKAPRHTGRIIMMMRSEKYLKSCIDEYVSLISKHRSHDGESLLFRAQGSSLERFRENYTDRSTELVKAWFASMQQENIPKSIRLCPILSFICIRYGCSDVRGAIDAFRTPRQEMEAILHDYILFEIQGWRAIIKDMRYRHHTNIQPRQRW